jgi:hypothetical protein
MVQMVFTIKRLCRVTIKQYTIDIVTINQLAIEFTISAERAHHSAINNNLAPLRAQPVTI